jgi:hypothetical protein
MNEPIEHAQKTTGRVTARDLLALLKAGADSLTLHGEADPTRASYSDAFVFTVGTTSRTGPRVEQTHTLEAPGWVSNGYTSDRETRTYEGRSYPKYATAFRPTRGFWFLSYCRDRLLSLLEILPKNAEISFFVYLDAGTSETLTNAGLHADWLYLVTGHRGKRRDYLLDVSTTDHGSARFGV